MHSSIGEIRLILNVSMIKAADDFLKQNSSIKNILSVLKKERFLNFHYKGYDCKFVPNE